MVSFLQYLCLLSTLLLALIGAMSQMRAALDEADIGSFVIWTSIASVIAGLPSTL